MCQASPDRRKYPFQSNVSNCLTRMLVFTGYVLGLVANAFGNFFT